MAVLRNIALGDVHPGHDLDSPDQRRLEMLGRRRLLGQHAVDAEFDLQLILKWFNVDVRRPRLNGLQQQQVDQIDQRGLLGHAVNVVGFYGVEVVLRVGASLRILAGQALGHPGGRRAVVCPHQLGKALLLNAHARDRITGERGHFIDRRNVQRVEHRHEEPIVLNPQGHHTQTNRHLRADQLYRFGRCRRRFVEPVDAQGGASLAGRTCLAGVGRTETAQQLSVEPESGGRRRFNVISHDGEGSKAVSIWPSASEVRRQPTELGSIRPSSRRGCEWAGVPSLIPPP